jgi:branched-chain amino acid transport system ATP-binding protein
MGMTAPRNGTITFDGKVISGRPSYKIAQRGIGLVPEGRQIFPNLSVRENLIATAANRSGSKDPWTLDKVLEMFPLLAARRRSMGTLLSGGEQQMLAVARALARDIKLLLLDEPYEGLAPVIVHEIERILEGIKELGITSILVEQNAIAALHLADRAIILDMGHIVFDGTSQEVLADDALRQQYLAI